MTLDEKERLARINDMGLEASAIRLRAAIMASGHTQKSFADALGLSKSVVNNAVVGLSYPNYRVMQYLFRAHRIDFNFMMNGLFSQLPGDVQDQLFPALATAQHEWDRRERSGQHQGE